MGLHEVRRNALKSEGCESRANIGNIARVSQMSHECRKLRGASDELGSDMGDCLQLILTQYEPNGNCVPTAFLGSLVSIPRVKGQTSTKMRSSVPSSPERISPWTAAP